MSPIVITVESVSPPAPTKKQANVFDTTGKRWGVDPAKLRQFVPGMSYSLDKVSSNEFMGKTYYKIEAASPVDAAVRPPVPSAVAAPAASYGNKDRQIFVQGMAQREIGNPNVNPTTMSIDDKIKLIQGWQYVFDVTFGGKPRQQANPPQVAEDMADSIPY